MEAGEFRRVILFMANEWDHSTARKIFGNMMGDHFFSKWCDTHKNYGPDNATMRLFYEMSDTYMQTLLNYIETSDFR